MTDGGFKEGDPHPGRRPKIAVGEALLRSGELADVLRFHPSYIGLMRRQGFKFSHGFRTTESAAREWLAKNEFHPSMASKLKPVRPRRNRSQAMSPGGKSG